MRQSKTIRVNDTQCRPSQRTEGAGEKREASVRTEPLLLARCEMICVDSKRQRPGTPRRQAPFGPCSQALFTTMTLTSKSNTFFFTPDSS